MALVKGKGAKPQQIPERIKIKPQEEEEFALEESVARPVTVGEPSPAPTEEKGEAREKKAGASGARRKRLEASYQQKMERAKRRIETAKDRLQRAEDACNKLEAQTVIATKTRTWNLSTSLKSYIDPRVYYQWGQQVEYDVLERFYPKKLRQKFAWVKGCRQDAVDGLESQKKEPP